MNSSKQMGYTVVVMICIVMLAALTGCSSNPSKQDIGTVSGAVIGGVVGGALTGSTVGTAIGAGAGAYAGNRIGRQLDQK